MVILTIDIIIHAPYLHFDTQFQYALGVSQSRFVHFMNSLADFVVTAFSFSLFLFIYLWRGRGGGDEPETLDSGHLKVHFVLFIKRILVELSFLLKLNEMTTKFSFANHFKYCYARIFSMSFSIFGPKMVKNPNLLFLN